MKVNRRKLKRHYEQQGKEVNWTQYYVRDINFAFFGRRRKVITRLIKPLKGVALDIGSGAGVYSHDLAIKGYEVVSLDISASYIQSTKQLARKMSVSGKVHCIIADAEQLPFQDHTFNLVLCSEVLEHLTSPLIAIKGIKRVSKVNALIYISMPSILSLTENLRKFRGDKEHLWHFTPMFITRLQKENSMDMIYKSSCNFFIYYIRILPFAQKLYRVWLMLDELLGRLPLVKYFGWCFIIIAKRI